MKPNSRPTLQEVMQILREHLPDLKNRYGVQSLGIFGSYVRGEQKARSDLDILVTFEERAEHPLTLLEFIALENELSKMLGVKVDLVEKDTLKPRIGRSILQEVVPV